MVKPSTSTARIASRSEGTADEKTRSHAAKGEIEHFVPENGEDVATYARFEAVPEQHEFGEVVSARRITSAVKCRAQIVPEEAAAWP